MNIRTPTRPLQGASEGMKRLAAAVRRGQPPSSDGRVDLRSNPSQTLEQYIILVSQSLAVFRFVSFAMGAAVVFIISPGVEQPGLPSAGPRGPRGGAL